MVEGVIEHLFRREAGRIVATLARSYGPGRLDMIEDVVQDALLTAARTWPYQGIPENPSAWLWKVARTRAIDVVRREQTLRAKVLPGLKAELEEDGLSHSTPLPDPPLAREDALILDEQLGLIFACCIPSLDPLDQVALTLKSVCGFSTREIARAFFMGEPAIAKRLVRARARLKQERPALEIPSGSALQTRLQLVIDVIYQLFTEGYNASQGDRVIRRELCDEAIRLGELLLTHPQTKSPLVSTLLALMYLQSARFDAREGEDGLPILLADQDRSRWNQESIRRGVRHLNQAMAAGLEHPLLLEAVIAACHSTAPTFDATDWTTIALVYSRLLALRYSPVVALNHAVALGFAEGPQAGLAALAPLEASEALARYHLFYAVRAELKRRLGENAAASADLKTAISLAHIPPDRRLLELRLQDWEAHPAGASSEKKQKMEAACPLTAAPSVSKLTPTQVGAVETP